MHLSKLIYQRDSELPLFPLALRRPRPWPYPEACSWSRPHNLSTRNCNSKLERIRSRLIFILSLTVFFFNRRKKEMENDYYIRVSKLRIVARFCCIACSPSIWLTRIETNSHEHRLYSLDKNNLSFRFIVQLNFAIKYSIVLSYYTLINFISRFLYNILCIVRITRL